MIKFGTEYYNIICKVNRCKLFSILKNKKNKENKNAFGSQHSFFYFSFFEKYKKTLNSRRE